MEVLEKINMTVKKKIIIGADHAGFELKGVLKKYLERKKYSIEDVGAFVHDKDDDYPDFAFKVAKKVSKSKGNVVGIIVCGSGAGITIVANKVKGIRAVAVYDKYEAKMTKKHNDANVLCLRGRKTNYVLSKKLVDIWLKTPFSKAKRHVRRINKIKRIEKL